MSEVYECVDEQLVLMIVIMEPSFFHHSTTFKAKAKYTRSSFAST
jgi:hypothetical protein